MITRNKNKIALPHGCYCSRPAVNPSNWKTVKASVSKPWYISYRFYSPDEKKLIIVKGMNDFVNAESRRQATARIMEYLMESLLNGLNPITGVQIEPLETTYTIDPYTPILPALKQTADRLRKSPSVTRDIRSMLNFVDKAVNKLKIKDIVISHVTRKHIKLILEETEIIAGTISPHRFNKFRTYLMMLFAELEDLDAIENNPVYRIKKRQVVRKIRTILTWEERERIDVYLRANYYSFWRFMHLFFHSGSRLTEMMEVKVKDVDVTNQVFKLTIKKGRGSKEVLRPIKNIALRLWEEAVGGAGPEDYVFSKGLVPGENKIQSYQITKRWRRLVKDPVKGLGITADFYSLKHLNLDQTAELLTIGDAADMAGHTSTVITMKHYATGEQMRQMEKLKGVNNSFT
jgi:site-specific recombinase XerC